MYAAGLVADCLPFVREVMGSVLGWVILEFTMGLPCLTPNIIRLDKGIMVGLPTVSCKLTGGVIFSGSSTASAIYKYVMRT